MLGNAALDRIDAKPRIRRKALEQDINFSKSASSADA
jgi:hypothetical protein